ncbi:MAG TPA: GNAT family N-acyltransferase [Acetobacteraceae bacterium]|nr:GNAT family N-acyltransferase [Acetobacteraceae bacterium]
MEVNHSTDTIGDVYGCFLLETADNTGSLDEVFRLRYQAYCQENEFETGQHGRESDPFDAMSRHLVLRHRPTKMAVGTARLVLPRVCGVGVTLPIEQIINASNLRVLPRSRTAEVSHFVLSKELRSAGASSSNFARLILVRGIIQLSSSMRLTHWCALMEPKLVRLLGIFGIHFIPLGGLVEHRGLRQPSVVCISEMLDRVRCEKPAIWDFITSSGIYRPGELSGDAA